MKNTLMLVFDPLEQFTVWPVRLSYLLPSSCKVSYFWFYLVLIAFIIIVNFGPLNFNLNKKIPALQKSIKQLIISLIYQGCSIKYQPFFVIVLLTALSIFLFNFFGLVPHAFTITSLLFIVFFFSVFLQSGVNLYGFYVRKFDYFNLFLPSGVPAAAALLVVPIEIIALFLRIISLAVRVFANMTAGHVLMKMLAGFLWLIFNLGALGLLYFWLPVLLFVITYYLEFIIAILQAYIFTLLLNFFINDAINDH